MSFVCTYTGDNISPLPPDQQSLKDAIGIRPLNFRYVKMQKKLCLRVNEIYIMSILQMRFKQVKLFFFIIKLMSRKASNCPRTDFEALFLHSIPLTYLFSTECLPNALIQ